MAQCTRPVQIGALTTSWGPTPSIAGLRDGLVGLGYREDVDFVMGVRFTQGDLAALPAAARELVQAGADVLIADSDNAAKAAQMATTRIPIIFNYVADPMGLGLIESFARPGGNITGVTNLELELGPERLEIFREIVPGLKRVLFPYTAHHASAAAASRVNRDAARSLGMELVERPVHTEADAQAMLAQMHKGEIDGILVPLHSHAWNLLGVITEAASQQGLPTMFADTCMVERGGLASYGPDSYRSGRQAARRAFFLIAQEGLSGRSGSLRSRQHCFPATLFWRRCGRSWGNPRMSWWSPRHARRLPSLTSPTSAEAVAWVLGQFGHTPEQAREQYIQFVREGYRQPSVWAGLQSQIYWGMSVLLHGYSHSSQPAVPWMKFRRRRDRGLMLRWTILPDVR